MPKVLCVRKFLQCLISIHRVQACSNQFWGNPSAIGAELMVAEQFIAWFGCPGWHTPFCCCNQVLFAFGTYLFIHIYHYIFHNYIYIQYIYIYTVYNIYIHIHMFTESCNISNNFWCFPHFGTAPHTSHQPLIRSIHSQKRKVWPDWGWKDVDQRHHGYRRCAVLCSIAQYSVE